MNNVGTKRSQLVMKFDKLKCRFLRSHITFYMALKNPRQHITWDCDTHQCIKIYLDSPDNAGDDLSFENARLHHSDTKKICFCFHPFSFHKGKRGKGTANLSAN